MKAALHSRLPDRDFDELNDQFLFGSSLQRSPLRLSQSPSPATRSSVAPEAAIYWRRLRVGVAFRCKNRSRVWLTTS
jgi:hypothetical protein